MLRALITGPGTAMLLSLGLASSANEQSITLQGADYPVPGLLQLPASAGAPGPAVLLLHGTASQKNEVGDLFRRLAGTLEQAGIASLRIDFAGAGDSPVDHALYTLSSAVADATLALHYLESHPAIDPQAIAVLGFSQGGLIAQRLVLGEPQTRALLTWSTVATDGAGSFASYFEQYYPEAVARGSVQVPFDWLEEPLTFSRQWFEELQNQRTLKQMREFKGPILAIAGLADTSVPYQQSVDLVKQSTHPLSRAVLLSTADHIYKVLNEPVGASFEQRSDYQLLQISTSWLADVLHSD